jgi:hypothetical protein
MTGPGGGGRSRIAPIFIVGAGRSGTTLLRLMLNAHPDIAIPSESHFIAPLIRDFGAQTTLSGGSLERATAMVASSEEWRRDFAHGEAELRAAVGSDPLTVAELVDRVFRLEVGPEPARWGDKTPANLHWVGPLLTCFPDGQAIAIVRDPRDVHMSLVPLEWFGTSTWDIGRYLARNTTSIARWREQYPNERFHVVRYEDLVLETERTLKELCSVLGVPYVREMDAFFEHAATHVQPWELDTGIHQKLLRAPSPDDAGRWQREGSRRDHAEIEALTVETIEMFGYERRVADRWLPLWRWEARLRHHARAPGELISRNLNQVRRRATSGTRGDRRSRPV